jgi:molecular chaperone HtpG
VKKISGHIMKKVADKLEEIFKNNREEFEKKWDDIKVFIEYGMISEPKFYERAEKFCLLKSMNDKYYTFSEYKDLIKDNQTDKDGNLTYIYTSSIEDQHSYIENAQERGYDILVFDGPVDNHFINALEQKFEKSHFVRVDAEVADKLIKKSDDLPSKLSEDQTKQLTELFEQQVNKSIYHIAVENLGENDSPVTVTQNEFMRRMKDMSAMGGGQYAFMGNMPDSYNLVVNSNHKLMKHVLETSDQEVQVKLVKQLIDLALLSQNLLKGEALTGFIKRSVDIIQ